MADFTYDWRAVTHEQNGNAVVRVERTGFVVIRCDCPHRAIVRARREVRAQVLKEPRFPLDAIMIDPRREDPEGAEVEQAAAPTDGEPGCEV